MDILWNTRICCTRNYPQQRSWQSSWFLVTWSAYVWIVDGNVSEHEFNVFWKHPNIKNIYSKYLQKSFIIPYSPPFTASDPMKIYNIILRGIDQIHFPRHVTKTAITIIKRFCRESPAERLGYQKNGIDDIKSHR